MMLVCYESQEVLPNDCLVPFLLVSDDVAWYNESKETTMWKLYDQNIYQEACSLKKGMFTTVHEHM
jgi:hypothetical protein